MKHKVFLSYNSADKPAVEALALRLRKAEDKNGQQDIEPWFDEWHLTVGQPWQKELEVAIHGCDSCVFLIGRGDAERGVVAPWQNAEIQAFINRQVSNPGSKFAVIPVLLPGAERGQRSTLPTFLVANTWVEFRHTLDEPDAWKRLLAGIRGEKPGPPGDGHPAIGECPYRGLEFFDVAHAGRFFGREAVTQWLVDDIRKPLRPGSELPRFLAILGASGSGKSSLARAGLYAALREGAIEGSRDWLFVPPLRPGPNPLESLELAVLQAAAGSPQLEAVRHELRELADKPDRLHRAARLLVPDASPPRRLFLLVDQFEEVFTACEKEDLRRAFIAALLHAARERGGPVVVALTMRADFFGKVAAYGELARVFDQHQFLVGPMSEAELRLAIEEPAVRAGAEFEPGLVDTLLEDVHRQPGALALLEHALLELWNRKEDGRRLTHAAYEEIGRLEGALERRANEVFRQFSAGDQELCRRAFLRLVHPGEGAEDTRRRVEVRELLALGDGPHVRKVVETLAEKDARLVVRSGGDERHPDGFVEIAHETLIRSWSRLRQWLDADRTGLRTQRRLTDDAREWEEGGRKPGFLYTDARLAVAKEWAARNPDELNALEKEFLNSSKQHQEDAQAEALRKERERAGALERLAEEQARAASRGKRQFRIAATLGLIAVVCAVIALLFYSRANSERNKAITQEQLAKDATKRAEDETRNTKQANERNLRDLHEASMADYAVAVQRIEKDDKWHEGVVHLARALKWEPANPHPAARLYSTLGLYAAVRQNWPRQSLRHEQRAYSARFSPDGSRIVTTSGDLLGNHGEARVWDAATGKPLGDPLRHEVAVRSVEFSPDGSRIVTASYDKTARVWDAATGKPLGEPLGHKDIVVSAHFSPDGSRIVTASADKTARVWDAATGKPLDDPLRHADRVVSAHFSPDGSRIVTAGWDKTARVWDAATGKPVGELRGHTEGLVNAQFSPDGSRIVTASYDNTARVWDAATGKALGEPLWHEGGVKSAQFSPDGSRVLTVRVVSGAAQIWDALSGKALGKPLQHDGSVITAEFSPDGSVIVTAGLDTTARLWDARTGEPLGPPLPHADAVVSAHFSPDGFRIVTAADHAAHVWEAATGGPATPLRHGDSVSSAQFSPDGSRIVTASQDETAQIWDAATGKRLGRPLMHELFVDSARFSLDGSRIITVSFDAARIWIAATGEPLSKPFPLGHSANRAEFSPDGSRIVTAGNNNNAKIWNAATGEPLGNPLPHAGWVKSAHFSPDGSRIVTASEDTTARVWDAATGKPLGAPLQHESDVRSAHFSPDGSRIVTSSWDHTARIWDASTGKQLGELRGHTDGLMSAQFSPDGSRIVTASLDKTARVWDAATGKPLGEPLGHKDIVVSAQFSPNASFIVTASNDRTAQVWDAATGRPLGDALRHETPVQSAQFSPDGSRILTASEGKTARVWDTVVLPSPSLPVPPWVRERVSALAGFGFGADGELQPIPNEERMAVLQAPAPGDDPWAALARWMVLPAAERTLTLHSRFTCRQLAERERDTLFREGLESALRYDPTVPLARLLLAGALLREDAKKKPDERDPSLPQRAAFLREYDLKIQPMPDDLVLWERAVRSLHEQKDEARTRRAVEKLAKLAPEQAAKVRKELGL